MLDVEALGLLASPRAWRAAGLGAEHRGFGVSYLLPTTAFGSQALPLALHNSHHQPNGPQKSGWGAGWPVEAPLTFHTASPSPLLT